MTDGFTPALDRLCDEVERLPADLVADVAAQLEGGPLEAVGSAMKLVRDGWSVRAGRHGVARLLLARALVQAARHSIDDVTVDEMVDSPDAVWRAAGAAISAVLASGPCSIDELRRWGLDCDRDRCGRPDVCRTKRGRLTDFLGPDAEIPGRSHT